MTKPSIRASLALALALAASHPALAQAQNSAPKAVPLPHSVPDAVDKPYPGTITLDIDASDTIRAAYRVTETIPVAAGTKDLILQLPQWIRVITRPAARWTSWSAWNSSPMARC
jgi:hypothetical protein